MHTKSLTKLTGINIASQWILHIINVVVNFFLIGYVVAKVGPEHYGGWTTIVSMIGYLSLLNAGLSLAVQHYVARLSAMENHSELISVFSSSYVIYAAAAVLALVVCFGLSFVYGSIFTKLSHKSVLECSIALRWVALSMFLVILNLPVQGALLGLQRYYIRNVVEAASQIARVVTVITTFHFFNYSITYLGIAFFVASCIRFLFCRISLWRIYPELKFQPSTICKRALKGVFSFGGHSFVWTLSVVIVRDSAPILATLILGPAAATYWYVGNRLCVAFGGLITGAGQVFIPVASSLYVSEKWAQLKSALIRGTRFFGLCAISGSIVLIMFGNNIIKFWVGNGYEISYYVLVIYTLGWSFYWIFYSSQSILIGARRVWLLTTMMLFYVIFGIILAILFAKLWGILGLTAGLVIPLSIINIIFVPYFASKACKVKLQEMLIRSLPWPVSVGLIMALSIFIIQKVLPAISLSILIVQLIIALIVFGVLSLLIGLDAETRKMFLGRFNMKTKSLDCS